MKFTETKLKGAFIVEPTPFQDDRGMFARFYCQREFEEHGLNPAVVNTNVSRSRYKGTLRGMHFQRSPWAECKLVRCTRGALLDVIIDLRPDSPTFKEWIGVELTADNYKMLFVPEGFAHGFMTLVDDTEATYQVSQFYAPKFEGGLKYNDPAFGIEWPMEPTVISDKDARWPDFSEEAFLVKEENI
ncbi:MAG: dTDP-4-dehydrorhamnose 3,5-epimerase [Bacteroidia bacterium]|nr:dTDP-4-dehydrorhamnose 3,5-epimerase [Bacteroidia bacterium]